MINDHIIDSRLTILVKPDSARNSILEFDENRGALRVHIKAPAEHNKANIEVIKFFSKLTKKNVKIVSGLTSKRKVLKFD